MDIVTTPLQRVRDYFTSLKNAYLLTFPANGVAQQRVLADLAKFCRANETCFHADARVHAVLEGRREVWCRLQEYLQLTPDELVALKRKDLNR